MIEVAYIGATAGFVAVKDVLNVRAKIKHVPATEIAVANALTTANALIDASMKVRLTAEVLTRAKQLRIISTATTGSDHIDHSAAASNGIVVLTLREDRPLLNNLTPAAELSWALVLACARRLVPAIAHVRSGSWVREDFPGLMLNGRVLGLIGCGRIGQWMARYGRAFGMTVLGTDPYIEPWPADVERGTLEEVLARSDVVSIHVHLSESTRGLLGASQFAAMKPTAILINTSRGAVVDELALLDALKTGKLAAAAVDVLDGEPDIADHPLVNYARHHDNLLITPHCGGFSPDAVARVCARAAEKVAHHLGLSTP
ncbi:MAG: hydroxyacid dehydrogenase [Alphaproteobacteria bacterium]|nr:hydroxyacid dehydrogenase [Alphaproteobacteria bacterium]